MSQWPIAKGELLRVVLDAVPSAVIVLDAQLNVVDLNRAASDAIGCDGPSTLRSACGEVVRCLNAMQAPAGCGTTPRCEHCVIRNGVRAASEGQPPRRRLHRMFMVREGATREVHYLVTVTAFAFEQGEFFLLNLEDVTEIAELRGLIPICASCKKVRNDQEFWEHVDSYLRKHTNLKFSHGLCPGCAERLYPETE
ncbi:MAG: hypothetical protein HY898_09540 [Deltaproteobacteria bacterium]|nr:hypothetical protein [Deltaproteobacteria bacterium]